MDSDLEACDSVSMTDSCHGDSLPQDLQQCYDTICSTNKRLEVELEIIGRQDYYKDLGLGKWKVEAKKLGDSMPRLRKLAFIGRTGVGKSTAINAILGAPILSTGADTEVIYEALPPSAWRASIKFIEKDEWQNTLSNMLDDLIWVLMSLLVQVYPHLRTLSFPPPHQDVDALIRHDVVKAKLGTEKLIRGSGFEHIESQETPALFNFSHKCCRRKCATNHNVADYEVLQPQSLVWHLVDSVRIYGAFGVLASCAVSLVDVPGFGDANKTRAKRTEEYLKTAEVVVLGSPFKRGICLWANHILVADIKRAADDQVMRDYLDEIVAIRIITGVRTRLPSKE
ncbi:hypothetical protein BDR04DRAFT_1122797 [Suillus decipiens]|nr:hypothetical protein BDR04DRAFT_1122797 [Suillus decipiens]